MTHYIQAPRTIQLASVYAYNLRFVKQLVPLGQTPGALAAKRELLENILCVPPVWESRGASPSRQAVDNYEAPVIRPHGFSLTCESSLP